MRIHVLGPAVLGLALLVSPRSGVSAEKERIVLVLDDRTGSSAKAAADLSPALAAALQRKGYEVVSGPEVEQALAGAPRLGAVEAGKLREQFKAGVVLEVTVGFLLGAQARDKGPGAKPAVGLIARGLGEGGVIWRNALSLIDDDTAPPDTPSRKRRPLLARASTRLLWSLPAAKGGSSATAEEDFDEITGTVAVNASSSVRDYDVVLERLRAQRPGPRFRLRISRPKRP